MISVRGFIATQLALVFFGAGAGANSSAKGLILTKSNGFRVNDKTTVDGTAFEVAPRGGGPAIEVQGEPIFNSKKTAFFSCKDDFESNHPQTEARLFDCSRGGSCVEVWHGEKGQGSRDAKWIDGDRVQMTMLDDVAGEYVASSWTCSIRLKSCAKKR